MKNHIAYFAIKACLAFVFISISFSTTGQTSKKDKQLIDDSRDGIKDFTHTDSLMKKLFNMGVGGASGGGILYEKSTTVGKAQLTQVTIGFQLGGQSYREVVFFQDKETLSRFKENKIELSAQVSAVAAKSGASGNAKYTDGILIFTQQKGGLMYEASVGGQKFKYTAFTK